MNGPAQLLTVLLTGPVWPRRAARRTVTASSLTIWISNLLGGVLCAALIGAAAFSQNEDPYAPFFNPVFTPPPPTDAIAFVAGMLVWGLLSVYVVALVFLVFAYQDEPPRDTWRHAVRTVRLFAPVWMGLVGLYLAPILYAINWYSAPRIVFAGVLSAIVVVPIWGIFVLGRALSVGRPTRSQPHEPRCEECGYLLLHLAPSNRCPECGESVAASLTPDKRWYPPAHSSGEHPQAGLIHAATVQAWTQPRLFFSCLRMSVRRADLLACAAVSFAASAGICLVLLILGISVTGEEDIPPEGFLVMAGLVCGFMAGAFCLWCLGASLVGVIASRLYGRNLLHAAFAVAAYTSRYFLFWAGAGVFTFWITVFITEALRFVRTDWIPIAWFAFNAALAGCYIYGVWMRMRFVRYANWNVERNTLDAGDVDPKDEGRKAMLNATDSAR